MNLARSLDTGPGRIDPSDLVFLYTLLPFPIKMVKIPFINEAVPKPRGSGGHKAPGAVKEVPDSAGGRRPASDRLCRNGQTLKTKEPGNSNGPGRLFSPPDDAALCFHVRPGRRQCRLPHYRHVLRPPVLPQP
jgi:hypothetical protein